MAVGSSLGLVTDKHNYYIPNLVWQMYISIFKFVIAAKPQQFENNNNKKKKGDAQAKHIPLRAHISWHYLWDRHQNKKQAKFCLLVIRVFLSGCQIFSPPYVWFGSKWVK